MSVFDENPADLVVGVTRVACALVHSGTRYGTWYGFHEARTTDGRPAPTAGVKVWLDGDREVSYCHGSVVEVLR